MGTIGLSFGSATSGDGFDVASTVSQIIAIQQAVETPWKNQLSLLQSQDTAFSAMGTDLATLATSVQALTDFNGIFAQKDGSSSDTSIVALSSATADAVAGSHEITVTSLAQTSSIYSNALTGTDTLSGSVTLQVGSGTAQTITLDDSNNTVSGLAAAINAAGIGVTASVITDSSGSRLSLVSGTSGTAGQLTLTNNLTDTTTGAAVGTQVGHNGKDASLTVDGIAISSSSNTVSNAIPGVTFQILNTSSSAIQVQITNDTASIATALSSFVTAYNTVVADIKTQEGKDSSGNAQPLYGDPTLALIQQQLGSTLIAGAASGGISSLSQLGIDVGQDGTLTFTQSTALAELSSNFSDAVGFFQNTGSFGSSLTNTLNGLSSTRTTGVIYLALQQNTSQESTLNKNISDTEARIATQKDTLTTQLNEANEILQSIPSQLEQVEKMYSAVTGYNTK
ncbi:MAG: flagellar filament capping protein FliD [Acidobacteriaceae bacterium]|nr:flagellar filament capping protein FliD [Acidobacteriaceae bacterium]